ATIMPALCIPTLCWIAPEIPQAMYSFGDTVFPVCPTCVAYGYQPASTTARVAATAPPSATASSSTSANFSGDPRPRPPATITSASSIDGPASVASAAGSTSSASKECSSSSTATSRTSAASPIATGSNVPVRKTAIRTSDDQPASTQTESASAGRFPTSSTRSTRSQL